MGNKKFLLNYKNKDKKPKALYLKKTFILTVLISVILIIFGISGFYHVKRKQQSPTDQAGHYKNSENTNTIPITASTESYEGFDSLKSTFQSLEDKIPIYYSYAINDDKRLDIDVNLGYHPLSLFQTRFESCISVIRENLNLTSKTTHKNHEIAIFLLSTISLLDYLNNINYVELTFFKPIGLVTNVESTIPSHSKIWYQNVFLGNQLKIYSQMFTVLKTQIIEILKEFTKYDKANKALDRFISLYKKKSDEVLQEGLYLFKLENKNLKTFFTITNVKKLKKYFMISQYINYFFLLKIDSDLDCVGLRDEINKYLEEKETGKIDVDTECREVFKTLFEHEDSSEYEEINDKCLTELYRVYELIK